tara:strand:- start:1342 stop:2187 length:846 start_codon:yes stop_codon:yes gene_type:complete
MKILRFRKDNSIKPGVLNYNGEIKDVSSIIEDWNTSKLLSHNIKKISNIDLSTMPTIKEVDSIAPCIDNIGKFVCIGLNYIDHAKELNMELEFKKNEPTIFMKATSSIVGPNDEIIIPKNSFKSDWEAELGVIIGESGKYIKEENAMAFIAGYCVVNDVSERAFQLERSGQWVKGKSSDTFGPIGPYLVTKDEIVDPNKLNIWLELNDQLMQNSSTNKMIHNVPHLVSYVSQFMSLQPGDIISTGTPPGVGMGMKPQRFLKSGDRIRLGIEGLGEQNQKVI